MKGAVAAFVGAVASLIADDSDKGSISLIITGDEEGDAEFGTWLLATIHSIILTVPN